MYGRVKKTVTREIYAMTLCMWLKGGASGIGTPFSYSAPGQANELVLIEWGDKPMELLIKDTVREDERVRKKTVWGGLGVARDDILVPDRSDRGNRRTRRFSFRSN